MLYKYTLLSKEKGPYKMLWVTDPGFPKGDANPIGNATI